MTFLLQILRKTQKQVAFPSWNCDLFFSCFGLYFPGRQVMGMVVYADMVFVLNLLINYTLLRGTARLGGSTPRKGRLWLGAALGAVYSVLVFLPGLWWLTSIVCKVLTAGLMLWCSFGLKRSTLRLAAVFAVLSLVLCGAVYGFSCIGKEPIDFHGSLLYPVSFGTLLLTAFAVVSACRLLLPPLNHSANSTLPLILESQGKKLHLTALRDSGNTLRDPLGGGEVITVYWKALRPILPSGITEAQLADPMSLLPTLKDFSPRLIPYRAVGTQKGLLIAITLHISIGKETRNGLVALSPTPVSDGGAYEALTGGHTYA